MATGFAKVDEHTISVTKSEVTNVTTKYDYDVLVAQKEAIIRQAQEQAADRARELAEVGTLLAECKKLGVVAQVKVAQEVL